MKRLNYGRALYYPYINFRDLNWVKIAALYYDGIDRIVPSQDLIDESEFISRLNEASGPDNSPFIREINPAPFIDEIASDFIDFVQRELVDSKKRDHIYRNLSKIISKSDKFPIHKSKMGENLKFHLENIGLTIEEYSAEEEIWYNLDALTGTYFMTKLANHIAFRRQLPIVSDDLKFLAVSRQIQKDSENVDKSFALGSIAIETVIPKNIADIPISTFVKFRGKYKDERQLFHDEINKLASDLQQVNDPETLQDILYYRNDTISRSVKDLRKIFDGLKIATVTGLTGLALPAFESNIGWTVAKASMVAVAVGKLITQGIEYKKTKSSSPYSYILTLKNELTRESFAELILKGKVIL